MFRNLSIRTKLIVILAGPLLALTILASLGIGSALSESMRADRVNELARLAGQVGPVVHELQRERTLTYAYVASNRRESQAALGEQRRTVDRATKLFDAHAQQLRLTDYPAPVRDAIEEGVEHLDQLPQQRGAVDTAPLGGPAQGFDDAFTDASGLVADDQDAFDTVSQALIQYTNTINDLLDINARLAVGSDSEQLLAQAANLDALARAEDAVATGSAIATRSFTIDRFGERDREQLSSIKAAQRLWLARYRDSSAPAEREEIVGLLSGSGMSRITALEQRLFTAGRPGVQPSAWLEAVEPVLVNLRAIEERLGTALRVASADRKASANRQALLYSMLMTVVLWGAVGLLLLAARSMVNPLVLLRNVAHQVAERRLPDVVERLQRGEPMTRAEAELIPVSSNDEIGQVADAFNTVHKVAVQVASEQAGLRKSIGDLFLNLARRNQSMIDRQLAMIDELEFKETEPERLEELFRLDHLATRMRRNAENLVVLSGSEPSRRGWRPIVLNDTVRAAVAEVEDYIRVEVIPLADLAIAGHAVTDIVHLLAELLENATQYSPPDTTVQVAGQLTPTGYVLEIEDAGIGMSDQELMEVNHRLLHPPSIDLTLSRTLGFYVVGRLAKRYGIRVQLRHSWYGGTTALVLLPRELLTSLPDHPLEAVVNANGAGRYAATARYPGTDVRDAAPSQLPIFESVRADWLDDTDNQPYTPLRKHRSHRYSEPPAIQRPEPLTESAPLGALETDRAYQQHTPEPAQAPPPPPAAEHARTDAGLPRRVPRVTLASQIAVAASAPDGRQISKTQGRQGPTPDNTGRLLSRYRTGLERARAQTAPDQDASFESPGNDDHVTQ
jgi:hypothetical protein